MQQHHSVGVWLAKEAEVYGFGEGHPFGPDRQNAFWNEAIRQGLDACVQTFTLSVAGEAEILRFHSEPYVELVKRLSISGEGYLDLGDTPAFPGVFDSAARVAGGVIAAADAVMAGDVARAFVPIAGLHHARRDRAAGFCVFNDIGVVIEHLRLVHGLKRIAYVDIDAHHGDGVFYSYQSDPDICIADLHEDGRFLYPGSGFPEETGTDEAKGTKLNLPLPPGAGDAVFDELWPQALAHIESAKPEFIILQCGADSIAGDPITHLRLSPASHARVADDLCKVADCCCAGRLLALGGGGYNRANLAAAWCAVLGAMLS